MSTVNRDTLLIHAPSGEYPLSLQDIPALILKLTGEHAIIPSRIDSEALESFGVFPVKETVMPTDGIPVEQPPKKKNGVWCQVWGTRDLTPEEINNTLAQSKEVKLQEITLFFNRETSVGFPYQFGDQILHVQTRPDTDVSIISNLRTEAKEAVAEDKETTFKFRTYENINVELTAEEMLALGNRANEQIQLGNNVIWDLKDQTAAAETIDDLPQLPESLYSL